MKKIPYMGIIYILAISIILVIPATLFGLCSLFDFHLIIGEDDPMALGLFFTNAPEGTVRIEPLVRSENGEYISISAYCEEIEDDWLRLSGNETPEEMQTRCGKFKAAYIDENGNVLGITDTARMKYGCSNPHGLSADGSTLTFTTGSVADWQMTLLCIAIAAELLTGMALLVIVSMAIAEAAVESSPSTK